MAVALDRPVGSFHPVEDLDGAHVDLDAKLARPDARGGLAYALDTARLQLVAQRRGYHALIVEVCTPRVRQLVDALVAPEPSPGANPGSRCRGWYQPVDDPPIRAVVQLAPDRRRYPLAVGRVVGAAAIAFGIIGIGATLLRRGPLRRRSLVSWLLAAGVGLAVVALGWSTATFALWLSGAPADPVLLGGGSVGEQVARTLLPGLVFLLPALLPPAILLTVPRRDSKPAVPAAPIGPPTVTWWPAAWWPQWAAQGAPPGVPPGGGPTALPVDQARPPLPAPTPPPAPPAGPPGWALPGSHDG